MDWRKYRYGLCLEEYNKLLEKQGGCCAICNKHSSEFKKPLYIDHNHKTKEIRGLLCHNCNVVLGMVGDDIDILSKSIEYLKSGFNLGLKRDYKSNEIYNSNGEVVYKNITELAKAFKVTNQTIHNHFNKHGHYKNHVKI